MSIRDCLAKECIVLHIYTVDSCWIKLALLEFLVGLKSPRRTFLSPARGGGILFWRCPSGCPCVHPSVRPIRPALLCPEPISWKCFGGFHWNLVQVYIRIRGWCTPNGIVHHLLKTELWPFISWKNAFYYRHFLCPEPYLGSALADFMETLYEYIYA